MCWLVGFFVMVIDIGDMLIFIGGDDNMLVRVVVWFFGIELKLKCYLEICCVVIGDLLVV